MSIAEKLTTIIENMQNVYDAGFAAGHISGIDIRTVSFDSWHTGTSTATLVQFDHGLGVKPRFVAFVPDDVTAIKNASLPSGITSIVCQADGLYNPETDEYCVANFIRYRDGAFGNSARNPGEGRLINGWDDKSVYVNANGSAEAWPPASVTTYKLICFA